MNFHFRIETLPSMITFYSLLIVNTRRLQRRMGDSCGISEQGETPHEGGGSPLAPRKAPIRSGNQHYPIHCGFLTPHDCSGEWVTPAGSASRVRPRTKEEAHRSPRGKRPFAAEISTILTFPPNKKVLLRNTQKHFSQAIFGALGGNRTPILRTGILRAIRCTTRAYMYIHWIRTFLIIAQYGEHCNNWIDF